MGDVVEFEHEVLMAGERTDDELIQAGRVLADREAKTQREIGEWFNDVKQSREGNQNARKNEGSNSNPGKSAKQICEEAGIGYSTAKKHSYVVQLFPTEESQRGIGWSVCQELVTVFNWMQTNGGDFERFLLDCATGVEFMSDPDPDWQFEQPWGYDTAVRQSKLLRGLALGAPATKAKAKEAVVSPVQEVLAREKVGKAAAKRIQSAVKRATTEAVNIAVNNTADEINAKVEAERQRLRDAQKEQDDLNESTRTRLRGIAPLMTREEFRLVLGCLHPDRAPADRRDKFSRAFDVIKRLEAGVQWKEG